MAKKIAAKVEAKTDIVRAKAIKPVKIGDAVAYGSNIVEHDEKPTGLEFSNNTFSTAPQTHTLSVASEPDGPMTFPDVHAILADDYPGYSPVDALSVPEGLLFMLPDSKTIVVERKRVKACANMEELRAYVGSLT